MSNTKYHDLYKQYLHRPAERKFAFIPRRPVTSSDGVVLICMGDLAYYNAVNELIPLLRETGTILPVTIITDRLDYIFQSKFPSITEAYYPLAPVNQLFLPQWKETEWTPWFVKLYLERLTPYNRTIYIETDTTPFRPLLPMLDALTSEKPVSWGMCSAFAFLKDASAPFFEPLITRFETDGIEHASAEKGDAYYFDHFKDDSLMTNHQFVRDYIIQKFVIEIIKTGTITIPPDTCLIHSQNLSDNLELTIWTRWLLHKTKTLEWDVDLRGL